MKIPDKFIGKWLIYHMDEWDEEYLDMEETAYIKKWCIRHFNGSIQYIVV